MVHWQSNDGSRGLEGLALKRLVDAEGLFYSGHVAGKAFGILLACRPKDAQPMTALQLGDFKRLGQATTAALAASRAQQHSRQAK